jgi:hypothetical protein
VNNTGVRENELHGNCSGVVKGAYRGVPTMKANLHVELDLLHQNVDEIIRLVHCAADADIWTPHEATRHTVRLEVLRAKLTADLRDLIALRELVFRG